MPVTDRIEVPCTRPGCSAITVMQKRSLRRYYQKNNTERYVCQKCTNRRISKERVITDEERKARAKRAKDQWEDEKIRRKMVQSLKEARQAWANRKNK